MTGGWYAPADQFAAVISPYLDNLPTPSAQTVTPGSYIDSVQTLGGLNRLNTTGIADIHDTFYAKSLMTPEASPMTIDALNAFMSYAGDTGFTADTVRFDPQKIFSPLFQVYSCSFWRRTGSCNLNFMVVQTLLLTMLQLMPLRLLTGARCLLFNSILHLEVLLSLMMALHCLMVRHLLYTPYGHDGSSSHLFRNGV